jgi:hypothetical protein
MAHSSRRSSISSQFARDSPDQNLLPKEAHQIQEVKPDLKKSKANEPNQLSGRHMSFGINMPANQNLRSWDKKDSGS